MIKSIKINNVKGIGQNTQNGNFEFDIYPNKPNIFVAPNGYGKSSFSTSFSCLNPTKFVLDKDQFNEGKEENKPTLELNYVDSTGTTRTLRASDTHNELRGNFDWFVINNQVYAKARKNRIGGTVVASASLEIPPIVLISSVPENVNFDYQISQQKLRFGPSSRVLRNLSEPLENRKFCKRLASHFSDLNKANGQRINKKIEEFVERLNNQAGTAEDLRTWIDTNELVFLKSIQYLEQIANLIGEFDFGFNSQADNFLSAIQIIRYYNDDATRFKNAVSRKIYEAEKENYTKTFNDFNSSWQEFKPVERDTKLLVDIPKTTKISNGQRDVMCFIALLKKAELHFSKENCLLIIDEVFDYLDDANLIAVQYYVTQLINKLNKENKKLYPIILTHLNPLFFKNFTFSKQKIYFLDKKEAKISSGMKNLLLKREDSLIKDNVSKYHFHYEPNGINIRPDFETLGIKPTWGDSSVFDSYIFGELSKYINGTQNYDPFAVCCAVRKKVEQFAYDLLPTPESKTEFINTHTTPNKLLFAEEKGINIPETYYLLGVIYNDGMHYKNNDVAIAGKLENLTIAKMIKEIN